MAIPQSKKILQYVALVYLLSLPFWTLSHFIDLTGKIPINLPLSALMLLCPTLAALILMYRNSGFNIFPKLQLKRIFDFYRIKNRIWLLPVFILVPMTMIVTFFFMKFCNIYIPPFNTPLLDVLLLFVLFFIGAVFEEFGWTGFITEPMVNNWGILKTGVILGSVWAIWHIIPFLQAGRSTSWIIWQCLATIFLRIIMVQLYFSTGKSLFAIIIVHMTINMSEFLFPSYGSHYNPFYFAAILIFPAIMLLILTRRNTISF